MSQTRWTLLALTGALTTLTALAAENARPASETAPAKGEDLAMQLQNPVAALISVPFQNNFEFGGGPNDDGFRYVLNFQPVVPISLNDDWNVISRTIVPFVHQDDLIGTGSQTGLGDIVQSAFFSPKAPTSSGWIWGAGPVFLLPSATDDLLGGEKFGLGPTAVALKQDGGWTYGALANHIWSVAGEGSRADISATFIQPFLSYTTKQRTTYGVNTETTYDWKSEQWTVPLSASVSQLLMFGNRPVSISIGAKYYAEAPSAAPDWGIRFSVTLLFPK